MYVCTYIYIYIERERDIPYIYKCIYIYIYIHYIYRERDIIYIYRYTHRSMYINTKGGHGTEWKTPVKWYSSRRPRSGSTTRATNTRAYESRDWLFCFSCVNVMFVSWYFICMLDISPGSVSKRSLRFTLRFKCSNECNANMCVCVCVHLCRAQNSKTLFTPTPSTFPGTKLLHT